MKNIKVLDCTLRDGGYVNNWEFGHSNIEKILINLMEANIDIIECGFLSKEPFYNPDRSIFNSIAKLKEVVPNKKLNSKFVCMINYGEFDLSDIHHYDASSIDGIRVVFHKKELEPALEFCRELKRKGYLLFIQPMVTINYSDNELLAMVEAVNEIKPYAFYIVDSFGVMKKNDLLRMFYLIDNNLHHSICIGYHSHNNLQLAYSNSQSLSEVQTSRTRIIDSSVFGMGRGAGNLNTELFVQYLNESYEYSYNVYPLLQIIDDTLSKIYATNYWGYSLPHYLSALYNCHPNYASYLSDKNTLSVEAIRSILSDIPTERKDSYNKAYIEDLYINYQKRKIDDKLAIEVIKNKFIHRNILVVAPGNSIEAYKGYIQECIEDKNLLCISVNFIPSEFNCQFTFVSNAKRYEKLNHSVRNSDNQLIVTSNIELSSSEHLHINYENLLNHNSAVSDNATLMLLKLLIQVGVKKVYIAGFDGYSHDQVENYFNKELMLTMSPKKINELNKGILEIVNKLLFELQIEFLTPSKYDNKNLVESVN